MREGLLLHHGLLRARAALSEPEAALVLHHHAMQSYDGSCHCGRVMFGVRADLATAVVCNCSMCEKKGFLHVIVEQSAFELRSGGDALATYRFNTGVAKHTFCRHCGVHPFYVPRSHPDKVDVNIRCLAGVDANAVQARLFDGKNWEQQIEALRRTT